MTSERYLKIIKKDSLASTNDYAALLAKQGAPEITIVRANSQTRGRGRLGRHWVSPKGKGIYATFIFRPANPLADLYYLPVIFSLAVARILKGILTPHIKLPNDVVVSDKKIAGILVEAKATNKKIDFVIAGIGININSEKDDLPHAATSLYLETGIKYNMEDLFRRLIREVVTVYYKFKKRHISELLKDAFLYQESKNLKRIKAEIQKEKKEEELVHFL